jgi:hypothetical protein
MVQLPGLNTPQFNWNLSKMPRHPMPVPPIFQPELAARAIVFLAEHPRRNMWVGFSTAMTILGNRVLPGFIDWYLDRTGVSGQLNDEDAPRYGSNAEQPRDDVRDVGAHGAFDDKALSRDPWSWASMHRAAFGAGAVVCGLAGAVAGRVRR